jgi:hypothetical protein
MAKKSYHTKNFPLFNKRVVNENLFDEIVEEICKNVFEYLKMDTAELREKIVYTTNDFKKEILSCEKNMEYFRQCLANYMMDYVFSHVWCFTFEKLRKKIGEKEAEKKSYDIVCELAKNYL